MSRLERKSHRCKLANYRVCDRPLSYTYDAWSSRVAQTAVSAANGIRIDIRESKFKVIALNDIAWINELM